MKYLILTILFSFSVVSAQRVVMQEGETVTPLYNYENNHGFAFKFNNGGLSVAGNYQKALNAKTAFIGEISLRSEKDEQEQKFYDYFNGVVIPNKYNYMLAIPIEVGIHQRIFYKKVDESFRPFVEFTAGPQIAAIYPYFNDRNEDQNRSLGEEIFDPIGAVKYSKFQLGVGGSANIGIAFGKSKKNLQSIRFGMSISHYKKAIELMEPDIKAGQKTFVSPSIVLVFGKIRK
jgi:hypothetical protein